VIQIVKPPQHPAVLAEQGRARRAEHETDFAAHRAAFESGLQKFEFDRAIYSAPEVRGALTAAQHDKCCFCETKIESGDVEHFRPKAACRQARNGPLVRPGYYWLAYEWANLYLACRSCNQRNKECLFPLRDPAARVRSHEQAEQLDAEQPMFIDPGADDPEQCIVFRENQPRPRDGDPRGQATILALELGREFLMDRRLDRFQAVDAILNALEIARTDGTVRVRAFERMRGLAECLARWTRADAEYASMTRCCIRERFGQDIRMPLAAEEILDFVAGHPFPVVHES
jgi:uncharacterized protein (TIGR02646 family)